MCSQPTRQRTGHELHNSASASASASEALALWAAVLDAAETLLREGKTDFSMRDLAARAGVSFATPFNQFGSKAAIMHALSERRIDTMIGRFTEAPGLRDAVGRVLLATAIGVKVVREQPEVNRTVMEWIGAAAPFAGQVLAHSLALWSLALGVGEGLIVARRDQAPAHPSGAARLRLPQRAVLLDRRGIVGRRPCPERAEHRERLVARRHRKVAACLVSAAVAGRFGEDLRIRLPDAS